jgi:uncharacterized membrane protein
MTRAAAALRTATTRSSASITRRAADDRGSTLLLTIFYAALALSVVLMVIAATSLYVERKRLFTLADGAALAGAEAFDLQDVVVTASGPRVSLSDSDITAAVATYLGANRATSLTDVEVESAGSVDGHSAAVRLSASWRPPIVGLLAPDGIRLEVNAVARSVFFPVP